MVEFLHARRWEKKLNWFLLNRFFNASLVYDLEVLEHFFTENLARRLDIVLLTIFLLSFWDIMYKKFKVIHRVKNGFDKKGYTWRLVIIQNLYKF